jgi:hypothetical protein
MDWLIAHKDEIEPVLSQQLFHFGSEHGQGGGGGHQEAIWGAGGGDCW